MATAPTVRKERSTKRSLKTVAREIMTRDPETVVEENTLFEAASKMAELGIRHLPVIDSTGLLVGMLSDRDLRTSLGDPTEALRNDAGEWTDLRVSDVMAPDPMRASPETTVTELATMLTDERIGAVPVVDADDRPVGIVSYVDLIRFLTKEG